MNFRLLAKQVLSQLSYTPKPFLIKQLRNTLDHQFCITIRTIEAETSDTRPLLTVRDVVSQFRGVCVGEVARVTHPELNEILRDSSLAQNRGTKTTERMKSHGSAGSFKRARLTLRRLSGFPSRVANT